MNISFDENEAKNLIKEICSKMEHLQFDENKNEYFFYGSGEKLLENGGDSVNMETDNNKNLILEYTPQIRKVFKGYTNWTHLSRFDKKCSIYLRWIINKIEKRKQYPFKSCRFPLQKDYFIKKYYLPNYCFN
jgi:hypothetical protein